MRPLEHRPDDLDAAPSRTLRSVETDVRAEARMAGRTSAALESLVDAAIAEALAPARTPPTPLSRPRLLRTRAWVLALAATLCVTAAVAAGALVSRRSRATQPARTSPTPHIVRMRTTRQSAPPIEGAHAEPPLASPDAPATLSPILRRALPRIVASEAPSPRPLTSAPAALYSRANEARRAREHDTAVTLYEALVREHPESREAQQARVSLGRMLIDGRRSPLRAAALFGEYLRRDSEGIEAETAMAGLARAWEQTGRRTEERQAWESLLRAHPLSAHLVEARRRIADLTAP